MQIEKDLFSREELAGYDRERLEHGVATIIGCGAAGNNIALNLALAGVGELRFVDPDIIEPSNLTRSPLFRRERISGRRQRSKAREIAQGALTLSYAQDPIVGFAATRIEALGLGGLVGSGVVISAVDSFPVRSYLADATRLLGIPLVEVGFSAPRGQVSVFPNQSAEEPCWRCLHPQIEHGGVSCSLYARAVSAEGRVPATQTVAGAFGAIAAEAAIQSLHGRYPLGGRVLHLDLLDGRSRVIEITADPDCPGVHRKLGSIHALAVEANAPIARVLDAAGDLIADPVIQLPSVVVVEAPCGLCGAAVEIMRPAWAVTEPPACRACPATPQIGGTGTVSVRDVSRGSHLAGRTCRNLGLAPAAIIEVTSATSGETHTIQLAGTVGDLFTMKRRERNAVPVERMDQERAAVGAALDQE